MVGVYCLLFFVFYLSFDVRRVLVVVRSVVGCVLFVVHGLLFVACCFVLCVVCCDV